MSGAMAQGLAMQANGANVLRGVAGLADQSQRGAGKTASQLQVEGQGGIQGAARRMAGNGADLARQASWQRV